MRHFSLILLQNFQARHQIHAIIRLIIDIVIIGSLRGTIFNIADSPRAPQIASCPQDGGLVQSWESERSIVFQEIN